MEEMNNGPSVCQDHNTIADIRGNEDDGNIRHSVWDKLIGGNGMVDRTYWIRNYERIRHYDTRR